MALARTLGCVLFSGILLACGGAPAHTSVLAPQTPNAASEPDSTPTSENTDAPPPPDPRALAATASFADVVAAARLLDDRSDAEASHRCLLRGEAAPGSSYRLEADVAIAVRPLSDSPANLLARLEGATGAVDVLTRWGRAGPEASRIAFATFTSAAPPAGVTLVLAITEAGVLLRSTAGPVGVEHAGPFPAATVAEHLEAAAEDAGMLVVTASPTTPLPALRSVLLALPAQLAERVAFGVALAADTTLPPGPAAPAAADDGLCEEGLPEPSAERPESSPDPSAVLGALAGFRENAVSCVSAAGSGAARGGRLEVHLRAGPGGAVEAACARRDTVGDYALRACVLGSALSVRLPAPADDEGFYDVALPLRFAPDVSLGQTPWCP